MFFLGGCANSSYHYNSDNSVQQKSSTQSSISEIFIGSISSSAFYKIWQREYFRESLEDALSTLGNIRVSRYRTLYRINVDLYDNSGRKKRKMGKFLGQKQYRIVQNYDVGAWYRVVKRGTRDTIIQDKVYYTPYSDVASSRSYEDAEKKVVEKKLRGIAKRVAMEIVKYFDKENKR
jgi:hypothetical protein